MTVEEAKLLAEELKGRYHSPYSSEDKQKIRMLHREVLGREMKQTNCQNCFHDAVVEIYLFLKKYNIMVKRGKYSMRAGFIIACPSFDGGKIYTNSNLTDEVAERYISEFPNAKRFFIIDESVVVEKEDPVVEEKKAKRKKSKR